MHAAFVGNMDVAAIANAYVNISWTNMPTCFYKCADLPPVVSTVIATIRKRSLCGSKRPYPKWGRASTDELFIM